MGTYDSLVTSESVLLHPYHCTARALLQVYEAVFLMATREFKRAAELLLDAIATFTR